MNSQEQVHNIEMIPAQPPTQQCAFVLVKFTFLSSENNTISVPIITSDGHPTSLGHFQFNAFDRAAWLVRATLCSESSKKWDAKMRDTAMNLLRDGTTAKVRWDLGCGDFGYSQVLLREDAENLEAWRETVRMLADSRGMHCVIVEKPGVVVDHFWKWLREAVSRYEASLRSKAR
ncbi:hypothetical protein CMUS01_07030 [Colletotrichum musicola]|uniref:Uncharacterized protein n=1 Tax=Colletotrichum musicola TaxID=2175873 RepID=A0A8H6NGX2_9PEZI|nr:hypothetical protein CMUS01_07030 [Colletotrichum musicola]